MFKTLRIVLPLLLLCVAYPAFSQNTLDGSNYVWVEVASGYDNPLGVTNAGDERLFGMEQLGRIWVIDNGEELLDPFLDISDLLPADVFSGAYTERGLLGLAFHPNYQENGIFFIDYTDVDGNTVIARYQVSAADPNVADPASATTILTVPQPFANHNGGQLGFGPDGYLYIAFGDGGDQGDPYGNAQNLGSMLGKILRIDVNAATYSVPEDNPFVGVQGAAPEVWAYGLRNPWRFSFDRATGDLYIADVGEWLWEEVDYQPAESTGGENYGWEYYEADLLRDPQPPAAQVTMPVITYPHSEGCSISGGYVYRGLELPELWGVYIYGDYCSGKIWTSYLTNAGTWETSLFMTTGYQISSFGEDVNGELYLVDYKGGIYRLEAAG
ncbi:MAG: PQQ-dependent sugar dehydrogenase [Anaerolineae bacterium]